jgi:predicted small secreted protein
MSRTTARSTTPTARTASAAVAVLLSCGLLSGCGAISGAFGGNDTESYCQDLQAAQEQGNELAGDGESTPDPQALEDSVEATRGLADSAPDEVADDWAVVDENLDQREQVLDDAGLTYADLAEIGPEGELPEGVSEEDVQEVGRELQALNTAEFQEANENISAHARDECDLELPQLPS